MTIYESAKKSLGKDQCCMAPPRRMDPDLLYVECQRCGRPILWEAGRTANILSQAGIDVSRVDDHCFIASDGCPNCTPGESSFETRFIRLDDEMATKLALMELADMPAAGTA